MEKKKRIPWNKGLTKETDLRVAKGAENTKNTVLSRYGVSNIFQSKEVLDKLSADRHSGELARRAMDTKKLRYGDPNYNNIEKNHQTKLDRYGDPNYNNQDKNYETRKINGTFNTSKPEEELKQELVNKYGEEDVEVEYRDPRYHNKEGYKYKCDFYVKSEDLFIELNYWQGHGPHPFDENNEEDLKLLVKWEDKANSGLPQYKNYIYVWTVDDPNKLKCAKENNLNYLMIYRNGLKIKI